MSKRIEFLIILGLASCLEESAAQAAASACPYSATLEALVDCIEAEMPHNYTEGFVIPSAGDMADWGTVVRRMLRGECDFTPPARLVGAMEVFTFVDGENDRPYCVLMETVDADADGAVDRGWGTFIVDGAARLEINHAAPHPYTDIDSEDQAIGVFKRTGSRSFLMAGTTRNANRRKSSCNRNYKEADVAHDVRNMFFTTTQQLKAHHDASGTPWRQFQWHGISTDLCSDTDVFISHGDYRITPPPGDPVYALRDNLLRYNPTWHITLDGGTCDYDGWSNTSGRLINGIRADRVCTTAPTVLTDRFFHVEHHPAFRAASSWAQAVIDTFGASGGAPGR